MNTPKSDKTIDALFAEFLAVREAALRPETYDKYEVIIRLYRSYLEQYRPGHAGNEHEVDASLQPNGTYCGTFGVGEITLGFADFVGDFLPCKVVAGNQTLKAAGTVLRSLTRWLREKGYTAERASSSVRPAPDPPSAGAPESRAGPDDADGMSGRWNASDGSGNRA
jgi:hypothetical protein